MELTTFTNDLMSQSVVTIPVVLTVDYEGEPLPARQIANLVSLAHAAREMYNTGQTIAELDADNVNPEYVRGQVELIIQAVYGLQPEDDIKEAVEALMFDDFTYYKN